MVVGFDKTLGQSDTMLSLGNTADAGALEGVPKVEKAGIDPYAARQFLQARGFVDDFQAKLEQQANQLPYTSSSSPSSSALPNYGSAPRVESGTLY